MLVSASDPLRVALCLHQETRRQERRVPNIINKSAPCYESRVTSCRLVRNHAGSCVMLSFCCCRTLTASTRPSLQTSADPSESCRCSTASAQVSLTCPSTPVKQPYAPAFPHRPFFSPHLDRILRAQGPGHQNRQIRGL